MSFDYDADTDYIMTADGLKELMEKITPFAQTILIPISRKSMKK